MEGRLPVSDRLSHATHHFSHNGTQQTRQTENLSLSFDRQSGTSSPHSIFQSLTHCFFSLITGNSARVRNELWR
jgi:hypothetical protein